MKKLYIVISDTYWNSNIWASRHYVPKCLTENSENIVVFIEKAPTLISPIFYDTPWSYIFRKPKLEKLKDNLYLYYPLVRLPFDRRYSFLSSVNQRLLLMEINKLINKFEPSEKVVISFDHKAGKIFSRLRSKMKTVYYVVDEITEFNWPLSKKSTIIKDEIDAIKNSDLVIATSKPLLEKSEKYNSNCKVVSHGVDIDAYLNDIKVHDNDIDNIKKPVIGFMGKIESWVDTDLIYNLASSLPDMSFVLIGPATVSIDELLTLKNIYYLGPKKKSDIPYYLKQFSVGIITFKQNDLVKSVNPLKLYEYLAAGLPVISTPMEAVKGFEEYNVYIEETEQGFKKRIIEIIQNESESLKTKRINFAKNNSWSAKADKVSNYCKEISK